MDSLYRGPGWWQKYQKELHNRVNNTLHGFPVSVAQTMTYHSFALQADKAKRQGLRGDELNDYCRGLVAMYLERRLEREVMEAILWRLFNVKPEDVRPIGYEEKAEDGETGND